LAPVAVELALLFCTIVYICLWAGYICVFFFVHLFVPCADSVAVGQYVKINSGIIIIIIISCHRFSFFPGTSPLEPVVNPTTQASSLSL
jgi:hypothetical protein